MAETIVEIREDNERSVFRFPSGAAARDRIAVEEPLEIRVEQSPLAVTMRTPGNDSELAAGFCLTEGVVNEANDIERVECCSLADYGNIVVVSLSDEARDRCALQAGSTHRMLYLSSSCGLCGTQSIDRLQRKVKPHLPAFTVSPSTLAELPAQMLEAQKTFNRTGGLHAAALFDPGGRLLLLREDVGRHNAVDKVIGTMLLSGMLDGRAALLLVSGRVSFEVVQKAAVAGIAFLAAIGAPTTLAIDAAARFGMTLLGFLRSDGRFNLYHDVGRLRNPAGQTT